MIWSHPWLGADPCYTTMVVLSLDLSPVFSVPCCCTWTSPLDNNRIMFQEIESTTNNNSNCFFPVLQSLCAEINDKSDLFETCRYLVSFRYKRRMPAPSCKPMTSVLNYSPLPSTLDTTLGNHVHNNHHFEDMPWLWWHWKNRRSSMFLHQSYLCIW